MVIVVEGILVGLYCFFNRQNPFQFFLKNRKNKKKEKLNNCGDAPLGVMV